MQFGEKIKQLRQAKNLTQSDLANQLNVERSTISSYETKNHQPSHDKLVALAENLGVSVDFLLNDTYSINLDLVSDLSLEQDEMELLSEYRALSNTAKQQLKDHAKALNLMDLYSKGLLKILPSKKSKKSSTSSKHSE